MKKNVTMWRWLTAPALAAMCLAGCDSEEASDDNSMGGSGGVVGGAGGEGGTTGGMGGGMGGEPVGGEPVGGEPVGGMVDPGGACGAGVEVLDLNAEEPANNIWTLNGTTSGSDDFAGSCSSAMAEHGDAVVQFVAPEDGLYVISTGQTAGADTVLYVRTSCLDAGTELACNDDINQENLGSTVAVNLTAGQTAYIVVDAFSGTEPLDFTLTVELSNAEAPVIDTLEAFYNEEATVLAFRAEGTDAEADVSAFRLYFLDDAGNDLPFGETGFFQATFDEVGFASIEQDADGFTVEFSAGLPEELATTRGVRLVLIDGFGLESEPATAQTAAPVVVGTGEACDPVGGFNLCGEGEACVNRDAESPEAAPTCQTATAPTLMTLEGFYNATAGVDQGAVAWTAMGMDAESDVVGFRVYFLDAAGAVIMGLSEDGAFESTFADAGFTTLEQADGNYTATFSALLPEEFGEVASIRVSIIDFAGLASDEVTAELAPSPELEPGAACDPAGGFNTCSADYACIDRTDDGEENDICAPATAPTVTGGQGYSDEDTGAFGAIFQGVDAEGDVAAANVVLLNEAGSPILIDGEQGPIPAEFETGVSAVAGEEGAYEAAFGVFLGDAVNLANVASIEITAIDQAGLRSEPYTVEIAPTPTVESGGACDEAGALGICPEGELCGTPAEGELLGACSVPVVECPEAFGEVGDLNGAMTADGVWEIMGDTTDAASVAGAGTCGGGGPQAIYQFVAPAAGDYLVEINTDAEGADTLLFARQYCGYSAEQAELGCNDDIDTQGQNFLSSMTLSLEADQAAYIFVDGFVSAQFGATGFAGPFTLTVTAQ